MHTLDAVSIRLAAKPHSLWMTVAWPIEAARI
jgi:hypothetical protein